MILGRGDDSSLTENAPEKEPLGSKRQEKLRKRQERGDPRVRAQPGRK